MIAGSLLQDVIDGSFGSFGEDGRGRDDLREGEEMRSGNFE